MAYNSTYIFRSLVAIILLLALHGQTHARFEPSKNFQDTTRYPVKDRRGDPYTYTNRNSFDFSDTSYVKRSVEYDPKTKQYFIVEKIGSRNYRTPMTFSMQEFVNLQGKKDENEYFRKRADLLINLNRRNVKPAFGFSKDWVNRITGNGKVDIKPSGYIDIAAGYQGQNIKNPTLPERARKNGGFDFPMNAQLQVDANIGDKIKMPINYNTLANFDFENQIKLDYQGKEDEVLKLFQAGNVNFSSKSTLIPGAQSLFGVKTQVQFGKLFVSGILANQRSQRQTVGLQGGAATQNFEIKANDYEENRHFLMAQHFRKNYNRAMSQLPIINSNVQVLRVEVWVTNRTGITTDTRDVVAFMDLGEDTVYNQNWFKGPGLPDNKANTLYETLLNSPAARNSTQVQSALIGVGLRPVEEFEKTFARKLLPSDFYFNPQIGFLSLNQPLQPDEVLGVAYQYTYNGQVHQVGEFSQDVPPDSTANIQPVLFLKLLKATSQRTALPIWELMMKNVYSVGFGQLERQDFQLNLVYEEPSKGEKRFLPDKSVKPEYNGIPLITLQNLDRLNNQNDPQPDGVFDYLEGFTVISSQSRIIFPLLEPFGHDLDYLYASPDSAKKYLYYPLYDTIKAIAQTLAQLDRFKLVGRSKSSASGDYQLGFNIPPGSVTVTAGGQQLQENIDYEINYDLGTLRVINSAIINSGIPVNIQYENNATFGLQQRNYMGLRLDYLANKNLSLGATAVRLGERPFFTKQSYGDDPIRNSMYGLDFDYQNEVPRITKWLNKIPFYSSNVPSSITAYGEVAMLNPGHAPQIGKKGEGVIYVDDFEGTRSSVDLRFPLNSWTLASVPSKAVDANGNILFPEADLNNDVASGYNRAKLAWYNIEPVLQEPDADNNPIKDPAELSKPETRQVLQREIFPQKTSDLGQALLTTFDMAYYPREKGPYNFLTDPSRINGNGSLLQPKKAWGGIMRNIDQTDFETSNIEFLEFWLQDPFVKKPSSTGGELYLNLGNISEDVLKDGKRLFENGLPAVSNPNTPVDQTVWGRVPRNPIQVTNAFSNDPPDRAFQDAGFDGLTDTGEVRQFQPYINQLQATFPNSPLYQSAALDPSADNFIGYRDASYDKKNAGILERYKNINNPHGNSPLANNSDEFTNAFTLYPDQEELNRDNTLNETEEYFQYRIDIKPNMSAATNKFITDKRVVDVDLPDGTRRSETWYLFRIPVKEYQTKVGNIPDFKSIRFIRMFLTNFEDTAVLRFGKLELIRNQWRKFTYEADSIGDYKPLPANDPTTTDILAVNIEENDQRQPIPYVQPPGIERQQQISNNNVQLLLNEQSLSLKICDLQTGKARGVFKTMNLDLRQYGQLSMFVHAESAGTVDNLQNGDLNALIRIGNDFVSNYYEIKIPLKATRWGARDSLLIWPEENNLDFNLNLLPQIKSRRNSSGANGYYTEVIDGKTYSIRGNPNLGEVRGMLLAVQNTKTASACTEVWFNELRLSKLDENGGWAALGRVDLKLADLGNVSFTGSVRSNGFGTLEQRVNERSREDFTQFDVSTSLDLGKLLPKSAAIQLPVYASVSKSSSTPEYDPYDLDIKLKDKLNNAGANQKDSIKTDAIDELTIKTVNFTNVKKNKTNNKKAQPWDISNLDFNYSFTRQQRTNPIIESEDIKRTRAALGYNFAPQPRFIEPLKTLIKSRSPWLAVLRDFNFNYKPALFSFKADVFRQFGAVRSRNVGDGSYKFPETFDKYFYFDRYFTMRWDLTRSLTLDFNAINNGRVDEPFGHLDTKEKKDSVQKNFWKGGRTTRYHHDATLSYTLPTQKLPFLDWTTMRATYTAKYDWIAASLLARDLGNTMLTGQTRNLSGEFDFELLYNKSKFLRSVNSSQVAQPNQFRDSTARKDTSRGKAKDPNALPQIGAVPRFLAQLLMSLKRVGVQYTEDLGTLLPGYMDSTQFLGMNLKSGNPAAKYVFGYQPDSSAINSLGDEGLLTRSSIFNQLIQQRYNQKLNITAQLSPIRDLVIDVNIDKTFDKQYSELYKDTSALSTEGLRRHNPYAIGSFSISYISYQTLFNKFDPNEVSGTFKQFEENRTLLSQRLGKENAYAPDDPNPVTGYVEGYGRYAQDVLIPSFLGAYTNKDPMSVPLIKSSNANLRSNPFSKLVPRPNWNVTYNGLSRIKGMERIFTNFSVRHGYSSTLSMNSFNSALLFQDPFHVGMPYFIDPQTKNYVPYFLVPNITISEQFSPLIEVDMTFVNQLSTRFEYRKSRQLSLSLIDYQLAENRSTEYTLGMNWRKRGVPFLQNVKFGKKDMKLDNDVTFRLDFTLRDDATANSKLDQNIAFGTAGQKVVRLSPSIDYVVNNRVNLKFYFEQNKIIPKIATSAPITTTRAGVQIRIALAP